MRQEPMTSFTEFNLSTRPGTLWVNRFPCEERVYEGFGIILVSWLVRAYGGDAQRQLLPVGLALGAGHG